MVAGKEALGSMGVDTPLAVLSQFPRAPSHYFKQLFAQAPHPPEHGTHTHTLLRQTLPLLQAALRAGTTRRAHTPCTRRAHAAHTPRTRCIKRRIKRRTKRCIKRRVTALWRRPRPRAPRHATPRKPLAPVKP
eukprot:4477683-Prymnesium_polylepis.1